MEEIAISKFKATCLAVLDKVRRTGQPILVTRFGKPLAEVVPPRPQLPSRKRLGAMAGKGSIKRDIVSPAVESSDWEALR